LLKIGALVIPKLQERSEFAVGQRTPVLWKIFDRLPDQYHGIALREYQTPELYQPVANLEICNYGFLVTQLPNYSILIRDENAFIELETKILAIAGMTT
jgi:hypothetical protein